MNRTLSVLMLMMMAAAQQPSPPAADDLGIIKGTVVDPGGMPVEDARVYAASDHYPPMSRPYSVTTTNAKGEFVLDRVIPAPDVVIHAYKDSDYYMDVIFAFHNPPKLEMPEVGVKPGETVTGVTVRLMPKAAKLRLNVRDANTKELILGIGFLFCREDNPTHCLGGGGESDRDQFMPIGVGISIKIEADDGKHKKWEYRDPRTGSRYFRAKSGETTKMDVYLRKK